MSFEDIGAGAHALAASGAPISTATSKKTGATQQASGEDLFHGFTMASLQNKMDFFRKCHPGPHVQPTQIKLGEEPDTEEWNNNTTLLSA
jgi:hypothetical protein